MPNLIEKENASYPPTHTHQVIYHRSDRTENALFRNLIQENDDRIKRSGQPDTFLNYNKLLCRQMPKKMQREIDHVIIQSNGQGASA